MAKSFDRVADIYDDTRGHPEEAMAKVLDAIEGVLGKDGIALDAGVGTGRFAHPLQARGHRVVGVDISRRMLEKAREKGTTDLALGDLCSLPFRDLAFDSTISVHVTHLISTWRCALAEIARVTSGQYISIATHREDSPAEELREYYRAVCRANGFEVRHPGMRERDLQELLRPDISRPIAVYERLHDAKEHIDGYSSRIMSELWDVPEEIHEKAVQALRDRCAGSEHILARERLTLIVWRADRLRGFAADGGA